MNLKDPVDVLARVCWGEARGEGRLGMEAVASVVLNRARDGGWWGHDVLSVCLHPEQFSCLNQGDPNRAKLEAVTGADAAFVTAMFVAEQAVRGALADTTNGADSYYAAGTPEPAWARGLAPCVVVGRHRFYRTRPTWPVFRDDPNAVAELNQAELARIASATPETTP